MDIKELALKVAKAIDWPLSNETAVRFATRLIAAYCEGQEPVARVIDGGGELHLPKLQWVSANHSLETPIGSKLFTAPPEPAPQESRPVTVCDATRKSPVGAAPSSEVREIVERLYGDIDGGPSSWLKQEAAALIERLAAEHDDLRIKHEVACNTIARQRADIDSIRGYMDVLKGSCERLAARVPDGCVVVPRNDILHCLEYWNGSRNEHAMSDALDHINQHLSKWIAAGEVK